MNELLCHQCNRMYSVGNPPPEVCPECDSGFVEIFDMVGARRQLRNLQSSGSLEMDDEMLFNVAFFSTPGGSVDLTEVPSTDDVLSRSFDEAPIALNPAPPDFCDNLDDVPVEREHLLSNPSCCICKEEFCIGEPASKLECGHFFHRQCIVPWLERQCTCPVCRKTVCRATPQPAASESADETCRASSPPSADRTDVVVARPPACGPDDDGSSSSSVDEGVTRREDEEQAPTSIPGAFNRPLGPSPLCFAPTPQRSEVAPMAQAAC